MGSHETVRDPALYLVPVDFHLPVHSLGGNHQVSPIQECREQQRHCKLGEELGGQARTWGGTVFCLIVVKVP